MAAKFISAKKGTKEFQELIRGTFSQTQRALPVQNLQVGSIDEEVTFEIVDTKSIKNEFSYFKFVSTKKLLFVLFPVFYFAFVDWKTPAFRGLELAFLVLGLFFSLLAVQIKIDIQDYLSGYDRIRSDFGQKVLSKGWKTVSQMEKDYKMISILALICSMVPFLYEPFRIVGAVLAMGFFVFGYKYGTHKQDRFVRDVALAFISGPCLALWIFPQINSIFFGMIWAEFVFFALQLEHFQHYLAQTQAGEKNLLTIRSFDRAPNVLWALWSLSLLSYALFRSFNSHVIWFGGSILILILFSFKWRKSLFELQSPAGSRIIKIVSAGNQLYFIFIALWMAELLFKSLVAPLVFAWLR